MRRRRPESRKILPDPIYGDLYVAKFVNYIMNDGKKGVAEKIFYGALDIVKNQTKTEGIKILKKQLRTHLHPLRSSQGGLAVLHIRFLLRLPEKEDSI